MAISVDDLIVSLRKDEVDDAERATLTGYLNAAESYVQNTIDADDSFLADPENSDLYKVVVLAIAGAYQQNPIAVASGKPAPINLVLNNIIGQLRAKWEVQQDGATEQSSATKP